MTFSDMRCQVRPTDSDGSESATLRARRCRRRAGVHERTKFWKISRAIVGASRMENADAARCSWLSASLRDSHRFCRPVNSGELCAQGNQRIDGVERRRRHFGYSCKRERGVEDTVDLKRSTFLEIL
jgi:hypothetical protein